MLGHRKKRKGDIEMAKGKALERNGHRIFVSRGNTKLAATVGIFNIPAIKTCPNCKSCAGNCYARKAEKIYPTVLPCREKNFKATLSPHFVRMMVDLIKSMKGLQYFRIHESGDFYSAEYAEKWEQIAAALPEIQFYGYTKSPYYPKGNNINIVHSTLPDGEVNFGDRAYIEGMKAKYGFPICPAVTPEGKLKHDVSCGVNCHLCMQVSHVLFYAH